MACFGSFDACQHNGKRPDEIRVYIVLLSTLINNLICKSIANEI
jgi:hypothetical protein